MYKEDIIYATQKFNYLLEKHKAEVGSPIKKYIPPKLLSKTKFLWETVRTLNSNDYIVIGGSAGVLQGMFSETSDIDIMVPADDIYCSVYEIVTEKDWNIIDVSTKKIKSSAPFNNYIFDILNGCFADIFRFESPSTSVKLNVNGNEIRVRPKELIKKDIRSAAIRIEDYLQRWPLSDDVRNAYKQKLEKYKCRLECI